MNVINTTLDYDGFNASTNHTSSNSTMPVYYQIMNERWLRAIFITLYSVIFLVGIGGNSLVIFVVFRNKAMQTITNIFITNLALSDILMCLLAVPFTPTSAFIDSWMFGSLLCHLVPMALGVCVYVSTLTSMAIAIDRYFVIVHPFKPRMEKTVCRLIILAIWIASISVSLPLAIYQRLAIHPDTGKLVCHEYWPKQAASRFFGMASLALQYVIPCVIITICYTEVSLKLRIRSRSRKSLGSRSRDRDEMDIKRKRRTNRMLIAMVSIFVICWLPLNCMHLLLEYLYWQVVSWQYYQLTFFMAHVLAMSSTIYNPFLYAWMNENFKKEFRSVLPFLKRKQDSLSTSRYTVVENSHHDNNTVVENSPHDNHIPLEKKNSINRPQNNGTSFKGECNGADLKMEAVYDKNSTKNLIINKQSEEEYESCTKI